MSKCAKDYNYPNLANLPIDQNTTFPDYGVLQDGQGKYKLVVNDFCSMGRMSCLYTKDVWSCAQRSGFYKALKNYQVPKQKFPPLDLQHDCAYFTTPTKWYGNGYPDSGYPEQLTEQERNVLLNPPFNLNGNLMPQLTNLKNLNGNTVSVIAPVELTMAQMNTGCLNDCGSKKKREMIASELTELLKRKCYTIGPCKSLGNYILDNSVPQEDFDAMVEGVVQQCKSQCGINTYKCYNASECRINKTSKTVLGTNSVFTGVRFGVGGKTTDFCTPDGNGSYFNCPQDDNQLSFCQYTRYNEATGWFIELDLPSACPNKLNQKDFTCAPGTDTCVPLESYEKTNTPLDGPTTVISGAVPVNVVTQ